MKQNAQHTSHIEGRPKVFGIYVFDCGRCYIPDDWGNEPACGIFLLTKYSNIIIDSMDMDGGEMIWNDAHEATRASNRSLPNDYESVDILNKIERINVIMKQICGEEISGQYWTGKQYYPMSGLFPKQAWSYNSDIGMCVDDKLNKHLVRAVRYF
jgi:hypothetical protein